MRLSRACALLLAVAVLAAPAALSQLQAPGAVGGVSFRTTTFNNGLGFGARAMGMAGAFTAIADDASAASWNPAGLGQLIRPEVTIVGGYNEAKIGTTGETATAYNAAGQPFLRLTSRDRTTDAKSYGVDFASYVQPWKLGRQIFTTQISYARNARPLNGTESLRIDYADGAGHDLAPDLYDTKVLSRGGYDSFGIGLGTGFDDKLYIGFTLNYFTGSTSTSTEARLQSFEIDPATGNQRLFSDYTTQLYDEQKYSGLSANVGVLVKPASWLSIGLVYRGGWAGSDTFRSDITQLGSYTFNVTSGGTTTRQYLPFQASGSFTSNATLTWPSTLGGGIAVRPVEAFTIAIDGSQTQWSRGSISRVPSSGFGQCTLTNGLVTCPVGWTESPVNFPSGAQLEQNNQTALRAGLEYVLRPGSLVVPLRVGAYRIRTIAPIYGDTDNDPEANFTGFTGGIGVAIPMGQGSLLFDLAGVFDKASSSRDRDVVDETGARVESLTGERTVKNRRYIASLIVRF